MAFAGEGERAAVKPPRLPDSFGGVSRIEAKDLRMAPKWTLALAIVLCATPALADDAACKQAAKDHASFKAIISDDDAGKPQYETVERGNDDRVVITRYVADQKRMVRYTIHGLFAKENEVTMGGTSVRFGISHTIDVAKLMPLKPNTSAKYQSVMVREGTFQPQYSDVTLTVGEAHEAALGGCTLQVFDVTVESHAPAMGLVSTFKAAFAPALDYSLDSSLEIARNANVKTYVTKLREIQPWSPSQDPPKPTP